MADYFCKEVKCNSQNDSANNSNGMATKSIKKTKVYINLWDASASECDIRIIPPNIYKNASGFVICGSYDNLSSLVNIKNWLAYVGKYLNGGGKNEIIQNNKYNTTNQIPIFIIFNKCDIPAKQKKFGVAEIKSQLRETLSDTQANIKIFHQVSAKENINVDLVFERILRVLSVLINKEDNSRLSRSGNDNMNQRIFSNTELNFDTDTNNKKSFSLRPEKTVKDKSCC